MRINNVSSKTSIQTIVWFACICILITVLFLVFYFKTTINNYSVIDFCQWYIMTFQSVQNDMESDWWIAWFVFILLPIVFYGGLIWLIAARNCAMKEFNSSLNLKSVDFLQGRINFNFNKPQYNITCSYEDIEKLEMVLHTILVHTKHSSYPAVNEVKLEFSILNGKNFTLTNVPLNIMKLVYSVIDYSRAVKNFSYRFEGVGEIAVIKEKIDDYLQKGFKQILAKPQETGFKWMSILLFVIGIVIMFNFLDVIYDAMFVLLFPAFIIGISLIFDVILFADKIKERKYYGKY